MFSIIIDYLRYNKNVLSPFRFFESPQTAALVCHDKFSPPTKSVRTIFVRDRPFCMETVFKADHVREREGGPYLSDKSGPSSKSGGRRHADRPP